MAARRGSGPETQDAGRRGEQAAAEFLGRLGYRVLERNFRCTLGEIDLVAATEQYLVFVEVKTRRRQTAFHPSVSVTARKRAKLHGLGEHYRSLHPELKEQPRFDVISVVLEPEARIEHLMNAF